MSNLDSIWLIPTCHILGQRIGRTFNDNAHVPRCRLSSRVFHSFQCMGLLPKGVFYEFDDLRWNTTVVIDFWAKLSFQHTLIFGSSSLLSLTRKEGSIQLTPFIEKNGKFLKSIHGWSSRSHATHCIMNSMHSTRTRFKLTGLPIELNKLLSLCFPWFYPPNSRIQWIHFIGMCASIFIKDMKQDFEQ